MSLVETYENLKKTTKQWFDEVDYSVVVILIIFGFIIYSIWVRYQGLGYSDFQGDEVNPMTFLYGVKDGWINYLFSQKRGPMQYVINILNVKLFGYHNEWQIRLPFFIFGTLAFYTLYRLSAKIFDKTVAITAVLFLAINGLFIAFARITQYQAFMYFLIPIGVYWFIKALDANKYKWYIVSGLIMTLALLAHYDTLSVFPFFIAGFIGKFIRDIYFSEEKTKKVVLGYAIKYFKSALVFFSVTLVPALIYYIPFYLNSQFENKTSGYLENRLLGGGLMPRTGITLKLITMYAPRFSWYLLFALGIIALVILYKNFSYVRLKHFKISEKWVKISYILFVLLIFGGTIFSLYPIKPRTSSVVVIFSSIVVSLYLMVYPKIKWTYASLVSWFLGSYSFYWFIMKDPRTHVYVSILPLFLLSSFAFVELYNMLKNKYLKTLYLVLTFLIVLYISHVNWVMFVDKSPEYPWWDKNDVFGNTIYRLEHVSHKKIDGVFGFNHYRGWDQIAKLYEEGCLKGSFNSNEKNSITYFYLKKDQKQGDKGPLEVDADNIIYVYGPHSWFWEGRTKIPKYYHKLKTIYVGGEPATIIYGSNEIYPNGKLLCE